MDLFNRMKDKAEDFGDGVKDRIDDLSCVDEVVTHVKVCHASALRTVELCSSTLATGASLVACGESIRRSLMEGGGLGPESFGVIADLIDGDKSREARSLAVAMEGRSKECISLSVEMVESLQRSVDALPGFAEKFVEDEAEKRLVAEGLADEERELADGSATDVAERELGACIDAIADLRLLTAIDAGRNAFESIKAKSELCNRIFRVMQKFASDVVEIAGAITGRDAREVIRKVKDGSILRAIGLGRYIKQFASACKRIMDMVIELFRCAADKLSTLWRALSHAKDVMVSSLANVIDARSLCAEASEEAGRLRDSTASLFNVEDLIGKLRQRMDGDGGDRGTNALDDAIGTAREVEAKMEGAATKMMNSARMVGEAFGGLPAIITDGIEDVPDDDGDAPAKTRGGNVDADVLDLKTATESIENADMLEVARAIRAEVSNIPGKVDACREMVDGCSDFADRARSAIDSFLHGEWTLETAIKHIREMCRLVSFSDLLEELAGQVRKLIKAISTFLRAISAKIQSIVDNPLDNMVDAAGDLVSDGLSSMLGKMFS